MTDPERETLTRPKYVDPNTIPGFYRANPDYQGEDVIETPTSPDPSGAAVTEEWTTERQPGDDAECDRLGCEDKTHPVHHRASSTPVRPDLTGVWTPDGPVDATVLEYTRPVLLRAMADGRDKTTVSGIRWTFAALRVTDTGLDTVASQQIAWATQKHQDNHAAEGQTLRWHCGGSDCGEEIARIAYGEADHE